MLHNATVTFNLHPVNLFNMHRTYDTSLARALHRYIANEILVT